MRSPARRSRWVSRVWPSSVVSSKSENETSIITRAFRSGRCGRNASFHVVAMDAVFHGDEALTRQMLEEICDLVERGALRPLPYRAFPACRIDAAFRLMASGKHIGKVVVAFATPFVPRRGEPPAPGFTVKPDGSYLITGAFGGYGKVLARVARRLRRASSRPHEPQRRFRLRKPKGSWQACRNAASRFAWCRRTLVRLTTSRDWSRRFESSGQPLRGVFHLAMVIDDAPFTALTSERMQAVIAPKAHGAWLLHEATRKMDLDCFVMFSSVSSIFGNPAQGNYSAANAFIDALAHHRQALGLPALTVNWGVLGGEGYVARNERVADFLARQGTMGISPGEAMSLLESFLRAGSAQAIAIRVDWAQMAPIFSRHAGEPASRAHFRGARKSGISRRRRVIGGAGSMRLRRLRNRRSSARPCGKQLVPFCGSSPTVCVTTSR